MKFHIYIYMYVSVCKEDGVILCVESNNLLLLNIYVYWLSIFIFIIVLTV